jgi:hypothetical protein
LWEADALRSFMSEVGGPVNVIRLPQTPSLAELAMLGVGRVSWATLLYRDAMARFEDQLASLQDWAGPLIRLTVAGARLATHAGVHADASASAGARPSSRTTPEGGFDVHS